MFSDRSWRHYLWLSHETSEHQPIQRTGPLLITKAIYLMRTSLDFYPLIPLSDIILNHIYIMFKFQENNGTSEEKEKLTNGNVGAGGENGVNGAGPPVSTLSV